MNSEGVLQEQPGGIMTVQGRRRSSSVTMVHTGGRSVTDNGRMAINRVARVAHLYSITSAFVRTSINTIAAQSHILSTQGMVLGQAWANRSAAKAAACDKILQDESTIAGIKISVQKSLANPVASNSNHRFAKAVLSRCNWTDADIFIV
eukprot:scaffold136646_cov55-Attheya_sp.AAC.1